MTDEATPAPTDALKADFLTALRAGASLDELGVMGEKIWGAAPDAQKAARDETLPAERAVTREDAPLTLAGIDTRIAAIDAANAPGRLQRESVRQAYQAERDQLLQQRYAVIEATNAPAGRPAGRGSLAAAVDPGPTSTTPLVADAFGRRADDPATATLTMPADLPAGATANQTVINGFIATVEELGVSPGWAQKLFDYDGLTLDDEPDPDAPPGAAELAITREVVELLPPTVQKHIRTRRHLERREFVSTVAKAGAPILRRSSAERNDIRLRIARRISTKGG